MASSKMEPISGESTPILDAAAPDNPLYHQAEFVSIDEPFEPEVMPLILRGDDSMKEESVDGCPFRDWIFGLLFWLHLAAVIYIGVTISPLGYESFDESFPDLEQAFANADDITPDDVEKLKQFISSAMDYVKLFPARIVVCILFPCATLAYIYAYTISVCIIKPFSTLVVKSALVSTVACAAITMLALCFTTPRPALIILALIVVVASVLFVRLLWPMVPFAAVNLEVALHAMSDNCGIYLLSLIVSDFCVAWGAYWFFTFMGYGFHEGETCSDDDGNRLEDDLLPTHCKYDGWVFLLLFISLYWTGTVVLNTVQVTVAGVMATWCFDKKEAESCCSSAVLDSWVRSSTYSFGSICLGSFFQGIIAVIRWFVGDGRNRNGSGDGLCFCVTECLVTVMEDALEIFNRWAYVFVGVYGYPYVQSGRRVMELFKAKGWMAITTDNLAGYVLGFTTLVVGFLTGVSAVAVERLINHYHPDSQYDSFVFGPLPGYAGIAMTIGFILGVLVCDVMMNVVKGATNTLIVCWADSPQQFEENHPAKAKRISCAWSESFPNLVSHQMSEPTAVHIY